MHDPAPPAPELNPLYKPATSKHRTQRKTPKLTPEMLCLIPEAAEKMPSQLAELTPESENLRSARLGFRVKGLGFRV